MLRFMIFLIVSCCIGGSIYVAYSQYYETMSIHDLHEADTELAGDVVRVHGTVGKGVGLFGIGGYYLDDGEDSIVVLSGDGIPAHKSDVIITGELIEAASINGIEYKVLRQKHLSKDFLVEFR